MSEAACPPPAESEEDARSRSIYLNQIDQEVGCIKSHVEVPEARALPLETLKKVRDALSDAANNLARLL